VAAALTFPPAAAAAPACHTEDAYEDAGTGLRIVGSAGKQTLTLEARDFGTTFLSLDCNNDGDTNDVAAGDIPPHLLPFPHAFYPTQPKGNAPISIAIPAGTHSGYRGRFIVTLGAGTNTLSIGPQGAVTLDSHSSLLIDVLGGAGADTVNIT